MTDRVCDRVCPKCGSEMEEWACIQEGPRFSLHSFRCFVCGYEAVTNDTK